MGPCENIIEDSPVIVDVDLDLAFHHALEFRRIEGRSLENEPPDRRFGRVEIKEEGRDPRFDPVTVNLATRQDPTDPRLGRLRHPYPTFARSNCARAASIRSRWSAAQVHTPQNASARLKPMSVRRYSTFGGTTG